MYVYVWGGVVINYSALNLLQKVNFIFSSYKANRLK